MHPISKAIHFMWYQGFDTIPSYLKRVPTLWGEMNPSYEILRWDYRNTSEFISKHYPHLFATWNSLDSIIKKCDYARLLLLHYFGGVYADCDLIPSGPLDYLLNSSVRYCQQVSLVKVLPNPYPAEAADFSVPEVILSREHQPIDRKGFGVANGIILAKPKSQFLMEFLLSRYTRSSDQVLDYLGPHALTRFIRENTATYRKRVMILCPYYFLWEDHAMDEKPPPWNISSHLARNHWGDHSRKDWWNI